MGNKITTTVNGEMKAQVTADIMGIIENALIENGYEVQTTGNDRLAFEVTYPNGEVGFMDLKSTHKKVGFDVDFEVAEFERKKADADARALAKAEKDADKSAKKAEALAKAKEEAEKAGVDVSSVMSQKRAVPTADESEPVPASY